MAEETRREKEEYRRELLDERLGLNHRSAMQLKKRMKDLCNEYRNTTKAIDNSRSTP
jgi:hypothetical protein